MATKYLTSDMQIPSVAEIETALRNKSADPVRDARRPLPQEESALYELASQLPAVPDRFRMRNLEGSDWNRNATSVAARYNYEALRIIQPRGVDGSGKYDLGGYRMLPVVKNDGKVTRSFLIDPETGVRAAIDMPDFRKEEEIISVRLALPGAPFFDGNDLASATMVPDSLLDADHAVRRAVHFDRPNAAGQLPRWSTVTPHQARGFLRRVLAALAASGSHPVEMASRDVA